MKSLFLLILSFFYLAADATNYYVSASGNDANNGTSATTPWKTLAKVNSFTGLVPGDMILFNRGETFYGSITINKSGSSGNPITYGAYGTGANPIITGFTNVTAWTNLGSNIWESSSTVSTLSTCNMVVINGVNTGMGRYPNTGYLPYQSHSGSTSITSSSLNSASTNWTGAKLVFRPYRWILEIDPITSHSGGTLTYSGNGNAAIDGYGFFIQNDARTLDTTNEWYYNPSTKKIRIYNTTIPANVQVSSIDELVLVNGFNYITFDGITFEGANSNLLENRNSKNIVIQNCSFLFSGQKGIYINGSVSANESMTINNNVFSDNNENAFITGSYTSTILIKNNTINNTGIIPGAGTNSQYSGDAMNILGPGSVAQYNTINNSGHIGIEMRQNNNLTASYNYISNFGVTRYDGGGIYSWNSDSTYTTSRIIDHNIILTSNQTRQGIGSDDPLLFGVYIDGNSKKVSITNNTVAHCVTAGIFIYVSGGIPILNNTCYDNGQQLFFERAFAPTSQTINNMIVKNNIFFSKTNTQPTFLFRNDDNTFTTFGIADSNYYSRPIDDNLAITTNISGSATTRTLVGWQTYSKSDVHSSKSPKAITTLNDLVFVFNATAQNTVVPLNANYIDVKNISYPGTITLQPYASAVLIRNGIAINQSPKANAGADQTITLPTNSVILSGSGSDSDGTISLYQWTKISGPSGYNIGNSTTPGTTVTGLVQGVYQFQLKVTDNLGAAGIDTMQVTVNAAVNQSPVSNAGSDQTIILPTNFVALSGSGTDPDGTISSYKWTEISGPSSYNIINANSASTNVTELVQGTYQFQLTVTDNNGGTATDVVLVTIDASLNIPPTANAGSDQIITLPVNTITLSGSGSDADGTVVNYSWTQISGPVGYNIVNANSPVTDVAGLIQGVYQFQLQVMDNNGAIGTDIIQVTVNAAVNIPPTANAGIDQTITLPINSATLSGSGTDADGTVVNYTWKLISGPSGYNIVNANSPLTDVTGLAQGTYQFQLTVIDNSGAIGTDMIQVTVDAALNIPPTANAGPDQSITLPINSVALLGSGSDTDGTVISYTWTQISGPLGYNIVNANSSGTNVTGMVQGTYQFLLTVTDNSGAIGTDITQVTVNAAPNQSPVANAGIDQSVTLPINIVNLSGNGNDPDGTISSYNWTEISGPSGYAIVNSNSSSTDVNGLVHGVYQFQLTVTDNNGATGTDLVVITVNAAANIPPLADAGVDQSITLPVNTVTLSGSGSDEDGTVVNYAWTQISGPAGYNIVNANSPFTDVTGLVQGIYQFQLEVTDNNGATGTDIIQVTVDTAGNITPVAMAGLDQEITLPVNTITLSGSGTDADGSVVSYAWTKISGPSGYNIVNANSASTNVTGLVQGTYQFQLTVIDNSGAIGTDMIQVTVDTALNIPPTANAGPDQSITLPINSVALSGSGTDMDGSVVSYQWTKISGPASYSIVNPASAATALNGLTQGIYQFQLTVTDNNGATGTDIMQVTVNATPNQPPIANAGADQTITLPTNTITLSGSGSDADGTVTGYAWTKISGPASYTIVNPASAATAINGLVQGVYQFQLTVTDNNGAIGTDLVVITVNVAANIPPTTNAGSDQIITLPVNTITLSGSGSDVDGTVVNYAWTQISGPVGYNIVNANSPFTDVTGLVQGIYQFQLEVTDNSGATGMDIMQVTVNATPNQPPVANAGPDQTITLPVNTITLSGSGSDADGSVVSYAWTKISGPSGYNIVNANSASTNVTGLVQGTYQFQLQVTDNNGAAGIDIIEVTVDAALNIPPTANAGSDQVVILPVNTITLSGSGSDADGTVTSYTWTKISGPASYSIVNPASAATALNGLTQGIYQFQLQVTDDNGAIGIDTIQVTVNAANNIPPIANAGADQTITLPTNTITLSGSGSDADGTVTGYAWTKISGPASYTIVNPASAATAINGLVQGVYQFQLTVTDNNGAIGADTIQITVNITGNISPVASAGRDQTITLPVNTVTLSGSGTDTDGSVVSYQWTKISGSSGYNIVNATSAVTAINGLVQGVYLFELTVTDNSGATGTDIMQVTVNAAPNQPPVANAGPDQTITLPVNTVTLSGSGTDADGTVVSYQWTKISGPSDYNIVNANSASTDINSLVKGVYKFQLKVTDNNGATGTDIIKITVNAAPNQPPVANAGPDWTITLPTNTITLSGSGSDADGTVTSYTWTKISGPASYSIVNPASAATAINGLTQGIYQFQLTVTDNNGATGTDIMQVTVNATPNQPPVANAGADQTITLPTNTITLSGSGSDADGTVTGYAWTKISGPASYTIVNPASAATAINGLVQGVYQFQLKVTDNNGATAIDVMQVTVNAAANIPPVANAGPDNVIALPINSLTASGSGSDADGTIVSYQWTKISGPSGYTIVNPTSAVTAINGLVQGVYLFELTITDNSGATGMDIMQVTVNATPNQPPVANAGPDQTITLPVNTITLSGSGSDADGSVVSYAWTKISGPSGYNIVNANSASTNVTGLVQGTYQFQLQVTDNNGAAGIDIIEVTVDAALNIPPTANAGSDQVVILPVNTITLSGSGSDADGTVTSYTWTKISGPASYSIVNPASAATALNGLTQGIYQFQLTVTDNNGATGTDIMQVTVNATPNQPPIANAGADQTITLPTNTITLSGSGSDADGTVTGYAWTKISGPASYTIVNPASAATAINGLVQGVYQFQLKVTDNNGATAIDVMQVTVNAAANIPPVANAGPDNVIALPINSLTASGSGSDADGTIVSYQWTKISGPSGYTIVNPTSAVTTINGLVQGVYLFELTITDNSGATGTDIMQVTVNAAPNQPPVANAGPDQTITLPVNTVTLSGSGTDADGTVVSYQWTKISGPGSYTIVNPALANKSITGLTQGVYQFQLKVTDNSGAIATDIMQVTVNAAPNQPPVANAGPDWTITLPTNTITLSGSGSDADGTVTSYTWTKISGPASYSIVNPASAATALNGLTQGIYQFQLTVTDNNGATGTDIMQVTVNATPNQPPIANAGADQTITLPTNTITLSGSGSDADGTVTGYAWTKISGPASYTIVNPASAATAINGLVQGVYQFQLKVTDNNGATAIDVMQVTVNAAANIPPVANAGPDNVIALPINSLTASGSGSDADGTIVSYQWTKISGPSGYTIVNPTSAVTAINGLVQGIYAFELRVTDNNGARGRDTMTITVTRPANIDPVADAGPDQTITLPTNSVILLGNGSDVDGIIAGYSWKQISGPSSGIIVSPLDTITIVNGLIGGTYQFELTVTDNLGALGKDTVSIVVAEPRLNLNAQVNSLKAYPNPVIDITTVEVNTTQMYSKLFLIVRDMYNHIVYKNEITQAQSNIKEIINMSNFAKGIYVITVYFGNKEKQSIKVIRL